MSKYVISQSVNELVEAGIIPKSCTKWELIVKPGDVVRARCEVLVTEEQIRTIIDVVTRNREDLRSEFFAQSPERRESGMELYGPVPSAYLP